jgi:hypothetical protein
VKAFLALIGLMISVPARGEDSFLEIARDVRDESGFEKLVAASFGGGKHYEVKGSPFFIVDLMHTSGIPSTELFVFESINGQLALRLHVPRRSFVVMKAEAHDGTLIVSEKAHRKVEWKVCFHVLPTAAAVQPPNTSLERTRDR